MSKMNLEQFVPDWSFEEFLKEQELFEMVKPFSKKDGNCPPISVNPTEGGHLKYFKVYSENNVRPKYVARVNFLEAEYVEDHEPDKRGAVDAPMTSDMRDWVYNFLQEKSKTYKLKSTGEYGTHWQQLIRFYNLMIPGNVISELELESYTIDKFDSSKPYVPINYPIPNYKSLKTSGK